MYAEERHQAIAELVASRGRVAVTELATRFDVTTETVRRDLSQLEKLKLLRRVHGGAVSMRSVTMLEAQLPGGREMKLYACCVITLADGLIRRIEEYVDPAQAAVLREVRSA